MVVAAANPWGLHAKALDRRDTTFWLFRRQRGTIRHLPSHHRQRWHPGCPAMGSCAKAGPSKL